MKRGGIDPHDGCIRFVNVILGGRARRALVAVLLSTVSASAAVIDWSTDTPDQVTNPNASTEVWRFDDVDGSSIDVYIHLQWQDGSFSQLGANRYQNSTPSIDQTQFTNPALRIDVDLNANTEQLRIVMAFTETGTATFAPVMDVDFEVYDIDFNNSGGSSYRDQIRRFRATDDANPGMGTNFGPTLSVGGPNSPHPVLAGAGLNQRATGRASLGDTDNRGTVGVDFGSNDLERLIFWYGSTATAGTTLQRIGIGNISFTSAVPEVGTVAALGALVFPVIVYEWVRRRRVKRRVKVLALP